MGLDASKMGPPPRMLSAPASVPGPRRRHWPAAAVPPRKAPTVRLPTPRGTCTAKAGARACDNSADEMDRLERTWHNENKARAARIRRRKAARGRLLGPRLAKV